MKSAPRISALTRCACVSFLTGHQCKRPATHRIELGNGKTEYACTQHAKKAPSIPTARLI